MRLDLYQAETERIAAEQEAVLEEARQILVSGKNLTLLKNNGVLHAMQLLVENAIGKAKQWIKSNGLPVPISAYDAFRALAQQHKLAQDDLAQWNALIGLRNRIVHDYMNVDVSRLYSLLIAREFAFVLDFLRRKHP